jgi:hypothetical protein
MMNQEDADMKAYESFGNLTPNDQMLRVQPMTPPPTAPAGQFLPLAGSAGAEDFPDPISDTNTQLLEAILQELRSLNQNLRNML